MFECYTEWPWDSAFNSTWGSQGPGRPKVKIALELPELLRRPMDEDATKAKEKSTIFPDSADDLPTPELQRKSETNGW